MTDETERPEPEFFRITLTHLEEDWFIHAEGTYEYAIQAVDARDDLNRAKAAYETAENDLKAVAAEVRLAIKRRPEEFGLEAKPTVAEMDAAILVSTRYRDQQKEVYKARDKVNRLAHRLGELEVAVRAMDNKKDGLEAALKLRGTAYFAEPRACDEGSREVIRETKSKSTFGVPLKKRRGDDSG